MSHRSQEVERMAFANVRETCPLVDTWAGFYAEKCKAALEDEERTMNVEKTIDAWFVTFAERVKAEATTPIREDLRQRCDEIRSLEDQVEDLEQRIRDLE